MEAIKQKMIPTNFIEKFRSVLKDKTLYNAFKILSCGNADIEFETEEQEEGYSEIIANVVEHFIRAYSFYREWEINKYCFMVNEEILRRVMKLATNEMQNLDNLELSKVFIEI
jgi:hypothetical protein